MPAAIDVNAAQVPIARPRVFLLKFALMRERCMRSLAFTLLLVLHAL